MRLALPRRREEEASALEGGGCGQRGKVRADRRALGAMVRCVDCILRATVHH